MAASQQGLCYMELVKILKQLGAARELEIKSLSAIEGLIFHYIRQSVCRL